MKWSLLILFFLFINYAEAQKLTGLVKDASTKLPIVNVRIYSLKESTFTDENGRFIISKLTKGDNLSLRILGYETIEFVFGGSVTDTTIYLNAIPVYLNEIKVEAKRNYKLDSINLRKEYAKVFNARQTRIGDLLINKNMNDRTVIPGRIANNTSSLVGINLLQLASLLSRKKDPLLKLRSTLLKAEEDKYIDHVFSKEKVSQLTHLSGEALTLFMNKYRPDGSTLKKMSAYELTMYIKKCNEIELIQKIGTSQVPRTCEVPSNY